MKTKLMILLFWGIITSLNSLGQESERILVLEKRIDSLSQIIPKLNEPTTLVLRDISLAEYIRAIGREHEINVYIGETPGLNVTANLVNEPVKSVFLFICKKFTYDIDVTGTILEFFPYKPPRIQPKKAVPNQINISFDEGKLGFELKKDSLFRVIKTISSLTGMKIITHPGTFGLISGYLPPTPLDTALEALFVSNGFRLSKKKKGYFMVQPTTPPQNTATKKALRTDFSVEAFTDTDESYITLEAENADLESLIKAIFEETGVNYLIYNQIEGEVSINAEITGLDEIMLYLLRGTDYTFKKDGDLYLIGLKELNGLSTTEVVNLKYRPTQQAIELIPGAENQGASHNASVSQSFGQQGRQSNFPQTGEQRLFEPPSSQGLQTNLLPEISQFSVGEVKIIDYPELNRIILNGPTEEVSEIADLLRQIDQPIPMVRIEMVVVEVNKNRVLASGLKAGFQSGNDSTETNREILPGIDYGVNGEEINQVLSNIPGLSPIGLLNSNFQFQLQAQESRGNLKVKMKPVLSMLNGREASLTIGQTQYFLLETQTASTGAVSNFQQFTQRFERIEANITLTVKPFISDEEIVTLDVIPDFTTPIGSFDADVPPTIATRRFVSTIRVKNGETVILGGLSQSEKQESTQGLPVLSRIPILKWFFGNVEKNKTETSLLIYITPHIEYL